MDMDWHTLVCDSKRLEIFKKMAQRRFGDTVLAEESFNYAFEKLSAENWGILARYNGQAKPAQFLSAVFNNLIEDFARSRFGRPRPPVWVQRLGSLWKRVYRFLCLERMDPEDIVARLTFSGDREPSRVWEAIDGIRSNIPNCGEMQREVSEDFSSENPSAFPENNSYPFGQNPEQRLSQETLAQLLRGMAMILSEDLNDHSQDSAGQASNVKSAKGDYRRIEGMWQTIRQSFTLNDEERLILRMVYQDGFKIPFVAKALRMPEHKVRRAMKGAFTRIRTAFEAAGLSVDIIRDLLAT